MFYAPTMLSHVGILTEASGRKGVRVRFWRLAQNQSIFASHAALLLSIYLEEKKAVACVIFILNQ